MNQKYNKSTMMKNAWAAARADRQKDIDAGKEPASLREYFRKGHHLKTQWKKQKDGRAVIIKDSELPYFTYEEIKRRSPLAGGNHESGSFFYLNMLINDDCDLGKGENHRNWSDGSDFSVSEARRYVTPIIRDEITDAKLVMGMFWVHEEPYDDFISNGGTDGQLYATWSAGKQIVSNYPITHPGSSISDSTDTYGLYDAEEETDPKDDFVPYEPDEDEKWEDFYNEW